MIPEPPEESNTSTVLSSSFSDESAVNSLQIPLIPADAATGLDFECPLCGTIQAFKRKASRSWRYAQSSKSDLIVGSSADSHCQEACLSRSATLRL